MKIFLIFLIIASKNCASEDFERWVYETTKEQMESVNNMEDSQSFLGEGYYLNKITIRVRAKVGMDLIAKFEVKPWIEFFITRGKPEGYTNYKTKF